MSQTLAFSSNQGAYSAGQVESHRPVSVPLDHTLHPLEHGKIYQVLNQALPDQVYQFLESHPVDSYADKDPALPLNKTNDKKNSRSRQFSFHNFFYHLLTSNLKISSITNKKS